MKKSRLFLGMTAKELSHMQSEGPIEYRKSHFKLLKED